MPSTSCVVHSVPSICALLSLILNTLQFLQRHTCISSKRLRKSLIISWLWLGNLLIYIFLLSGLSWIIYREKLCRLVVIFILLLSLNWILNLCSLYWNQISKNKIAIAFQVLASILELVSITWLVVISLTSDQIENIPFYYWIILIGSVVWGYLCNLLWLNSLYALRQSHLPYENLLNDDDINASHGSEHISPHEAKITQSMFYFWFTPVLTVGSGSSIEWDDLTELPESMASNITRSYLQPSDDDSYETSTSHSVFNFIFGCVTCGDKKSGDNDDEVEVTSDPLLPPLSHAAPLIRAILVDGARGSTFLLLGFIKLCTIGLSFVGPLLLGQMVKLIENDPSRKDIPLGLLLSCTLGASFILSAVLNTQYTIRANVLQMKVRSALALGLFSRALRLPLCKHVSLGITDAKLSNMQQVDVGRAGDTITAIHDLWSLPLQILIAFILLYLQVNVGFLAGVVIILVMIPLNRFIAVKIGAATKELMIHKDARIKLMTECFRSIKSIKMSGLETTMSARSMIHRENELKYLSQRKYLDAWCVFLWASLPLLVPYITFVTTVAALNRQLTASEVFTTIALLNMLIFPMNAYPWIINGAVEASVSIRRLSSVLIVPPYSPDDDNSETHLDLGVLASKEIKHMTSPSSEIDDFHEPSRKKSALSTLFGGQSDDQLTSAELLARSGDRNSHSLIDVKDLLISWNEEMIGGVPPSRSSSRESSSSDRLLDRKLVLKDSNFVVGPITLKSILPGQVIGICGSVGSGKTTLFMGLLSECYTSSSSSESVLKASVSYCSQNPRLHAGTVRTNVCFESPYRRERYYLIMKGCCLDEDFCLYEKSLGDEIGSSYGMDEEDIGQGGSRLSGGQRLRVGIARSLYSTSGIVLLDDPFSALDRNTAQRLMSFIVALATREKRVILLVTNEIHMLKTGVSRIIFLSNGRVVGSGSYQELYESHESFRNMIEKTVENIVWSESMEVESSSLLPEDEETGKKGGKGQKSEFGHEEDSEHMGRGEIEGKVYRAYFRAAGFGVVALVLSATLLMQTSANGMSFWLAYWSDRIENVSDNQFVIISSLIVGINVVFAFIRSFSFAWGGLIAARKEYEKLTESTLSTFIYFFETTNLGRIINRFGKDSDIIDDQLPFMLNRVLAQIFTLIGALVVISISSVLVIGIVVIVSMIYYRLQIFYRKSSRDIRRLDAIYRSPVGNLLLDCLANAPTIRAQKLQENFEDKMAQAIDASQRVTLTGNIAAQWLSIRLQLLGVFITFSLAFASVFNAVYHVAPISASMLGLSLSYAFSLVANLNNLVNSVIETEQEMISVERVEEYVSLPSEFRAVDHPANDPSTLSTSTATFHISTRSLSTESAIGDGHLGSLDWPLDGSIVLNNVSFSYHMERRYFERENLLPSSNAVLGQIYNGGWQNTAATATGGTLSDTPPKRRESLFGTTDADLEDISLPYALKNISVVIPTGSRVAVVGRTGSGKSSFLRTILNLNKHYRGQVLVGGVNIKELSKHVLRRNCGVISQDPFLFTGTIRDNLDPRGLYSDHELVQVQYFLHSRTSIRINTDQALCKCGIMETFSENSDIGILMRDVAAEFQFKDTGVRESNEAEQRPVTSSTPTVVSVAAEMLLNCHVVDAASTLSQGQKQLLCVARILLGNPRFVFLDEASSSLDPTSELLMYKALQAHLPPQTTVLAVSHRYDREGIRSLCTQVLELDNGRVTKYEDIFFL